jgi:hypothetical protein
VKLAFQKKLAPVPCPEALVAVFIPARRWAILKAREGRYLICTGFPRLAINFKYFSRAFSSNRVRYYWPGPSLLSSAAYDHNDIR